MSVVIALVVFFVCFGAGVLVAGRRVPSGSLNGGAFFAVRWLIGAGFAAVGVHTFLAVRELEAKNDELTRLLGGSSRIVGNALVAILFDAGVLFGLAALVYLVGLRRSDSP
jgi:hypothetical protein